EKKEKNPLSFWEGRLVFDIEERVRAELRENNRDFDSSVDDDNDDAWLLNRFRLGLTVKPVSWLKIYGQTQDAREAFSDRANIPGVRSSEGDDELDLRQAYVAIGDTKKFPLLLTIGRQSISYGDSRLVADSRWRNFGRSFDALRLRFEEPNSGVEGFAMRPVDIKRAIFSRAPPARSASTCKLLPRMFPAVTPRNSCLGPRGLDWNMTTRQAIRIPTTMIHSHFRICSPRTTRSMGSWMNSAGATF